MKKSISLFIILFGLNFLQAQTQTTQLQLKGEFKEINVQKQDEVISILNNANKKIRKQYVDSIIKTPNEYNPAVLYALSKELFNENRKDDATFWFYVAQLRCRYDTNLCLDPSVDGHTALLNSTYGPEINSYAVKDIKMLEKTINLVLDFVKNNNEEYDHRWLSLHGMRAITKSLNESQKVQPMLQPKEKWAEIKQETIADYQNGFAGFLQTMKSRK